jgi:predicted permease
MDASSSGSGRKSLRSYVWFDAACHDLRDARRALWHSRQFAIWVVGSLAIGMAVAIAALALLNAVQFRPFPGVAEQERLVRVAVSRGCGRPDCWIRMSSPADYEALQDGLTGLRGLAAYTVGDVAAALPAARSMRGALTSANYFEVLGVRPALGRIFDTSDSTTHARVAVLAHSVWTREFGSDPAVIGRSMRVADEIVQIVGVAPPFFVGIDLRPGGRGLDVWLPMWLADAVLPRTIAEQRRQERDVYFAGRLRDDVDVVQVEAQAQMLALRLATARGEGQPGRAQVRRVWIINPENRHLGVLVLMPIPILVLAIACVNAANLMLARGSQRQREIAIRLAVGAGRRRVVRQLLLESACLALLATVVAVPIAWQGLRLAGSPLSIPIPIDTTVLALTILIAAGTTIAFGLAPALSATEEQPLRTLRGGPHGAASPPQSRMRRGLLMAQVALSLGLLATAWQLVATVRLQAVSGGTPAERLLIARFDLQPLKRPAAEVESFYRRLLDETSRLPGVEAAGMARHGSVWTFGSGAAAGSIIVWHQADAPDEGRVTIGGYAAGDLFQALGLRVIHGRAFTEADRRTRPQVAVVNQTFADNLNGVPVGSILRVAPRERNFAESIEVRVVGIIEPSLEPRYGEDGRPAAKIYLPSPIEPEPALALYVRTSTAATSFVQRIAGLVSEISPRVPILEIGSLVELNERSFGPQLWLARLAAFLGVIGLLLATAGLYGVSSYVVAIRSREIAIRMAVGARPRAILAMVLGQSMRTALLGLAVGGAAAVAVSRVIQSEYHGIQDIDGTAFAGAAALFLAAMLLAGAIPAVRASRLDPVESLKDI